MGESRKIRVFVGTMKALQNNVPSIKQLESACDELSQELVLLERKLQLLTGQSEAAIKERGRLQTSRTRLRGRLRALRAQLPMRDFEKLYAEMRAVPMVQDIYVNDDLSTRLLVIVTRTLYGLSEGGQWHRIGAFKIEIDLVDPASDVKLPSMGEIKSVRWLNLEGTVHCHAGPGGSTEGNWQSPMYINEQGHSVCFGIDRPMLKKALADQDWLTATKIVVRYPECPGQCQAIMHWPKVDRKDVPEWYLKNFD